MTIAAAVLGASGYVGGELLRLIHGHPEFELAAAISGSNNGRPIRDVFPQLGAAYGDVAFAAPERWLDELADGRALALFSAAPHGASASAVARCLDSAATRGLDVHVVDCSADFRYPDAERFESVYKLQHPQPALLDHFTCAIPEHSPAQFARHAGHPGCFATASLLAAVPLAGADVVDGDLMISAITGSTGSGREPKPGTHHPERHSNLYAYKPLAHRHGPEIHDLILQATGKAIGVNFVPHSGPYARGIYATVMAATKKSLDGSALRDIYEDYYQAAHFVQIVDNEPRLKNVVASNYAQIGVASDGRNVVVMCAIDNLVKGAAGGAVQWMNRLWSLPETTGLTASPPAWT